MSRGLKVLMVGPYPLGNTSIGGVETALSGLTAGLSALEEVEHIHIADLRPGVDSSSERLSARLTIHRLPAQSKLRLLNGAAADVRSLRSLCREIRPDIAHGQGISLMGGLATRLGIPSVVTVHGMIDVEARALSDGGLADRFRVMLIERSVRSTLRRADAVISISRYDHSGISRFGEPRNHRVIPNAVIAPCDAVSSPDAPTALYTGLIIPRKNIVGLVRAFRGVRSKVPGARLVLAGAIGDHKYALEVFSAIDQAPDGIEYVGSLDRHALGQQLNEAGALVMFSDQETLPCSISEALLCGRPVVSSNVGGISEMVTEGITGMLVPARNEEALENALVQLLSSRDLRLSMGDAAREFGATHYDPTAVAARTLEVYQHVLEGR